MISQYNKPAAEQYAVKGLTSIVSKRLKVEGFVVTDPSFFCYRDERDEKMIQVRKNPSAEDNTLLTLVCSGSRTERSKASNM
jgi:NADPH-dependent curcumin reductase CurA